MALVSKNFNCSLIEVEAMALDKVLRYAHEAMRLMVLPEVSDE